MNPATDKRHFEYHGPTVITLSTTDQAFVPISIVNDADSALPSITGLQAYLQKVQWGFPNFEEARFWNVGAQEWDEYSDVEEYDTEIVVKPAAVMNDGVVTPSPVWQKGYFVALPTHPETGPGAGCYNLIVKCDQVEAALIQAISFVEPSSATQLSDIHAALLNDQIIDDAAKTLHIRTADKTANQFSFTLKDAQGLPSIREVMRKERVI